MRRFSFLTGVFIITLTLPASAACIQKTNGNFVVRGGFVTDQKSNLVWKRCAVGMNWNADESRCTGEPEGLDQEAARRAAKNAGEEWRVPTGGELETLLFDTCQGPKIDSMAFPSISSSDFGEGANFWTSTEALPGMFYYFEFMNGYADMHSAGFKLSVLLVRDK
ncbi:MAG: DUF1566 domain-containing protein [Rhodospirillaceae bacterium]|nr:DUF1566 domain-containing protein [Rhodospirillaceae bacterium]